MWGVLRVLRERNSFFSKKPIKDRNDQRLINIKNMKPLQKQMSPCITWKAPGWSSRGMKLSHIPLPTILNVSEGYVILSLFAALPHPENPSVHVFLLSVKAQLHSARSAMANTHRSAAIPLLLMPCLVSSVPPGCSSGSEAKMCRTWGKLCVRVCVCVSLFVCWGHEPYFLCKEGRLGANTQAALCFLVCLGR